ncbi:hypothetical protein E2C01_090189 [Portunus trituberculatus]|uniref:Uncharacterized protein n=1 Tax=Portunus trituberculatus TaxID=210409 RepID=A0A5B7JPF7_PORTR|nr:hypothetical protein [Portunus trituberculatus]
MDGGLVMCLVIVGGRVLVVRGHTTLYDSPMPRRREPMNQSVFQLGEEEEKEEEEDGGSE